MMFHGHILTSYWVHAFSPLVLIINRLPSKMLSIWSPFEVLFAQVPSYEKFRPFECKCTLNYVTTQNTNYLPVSSRIFITRNARFDESCFPFDSSTKDTPFTTLPLHSLLVDVPLNSGYFSVHAPQPPTHSLIPKPPSHVYGICDDSTTPNPDTMPHSETPPDTPEVVTTHSKV